MLSQDASPEDNLNNFSGPYFHIPSLIPCSRTNMIRKIVQSFGNEALAVGAKVLFSSPYLLVSKIGIDREFATVKYGD